MTRFDSRVRGDPIEVASNLQALIYKSNNMSLDEKELSFDDNNKEETNDYIVSTVKEDYIINESHGKQINTNC